MTIVTTIIWFLFIITLLVVVHELGHYLFSILFGTKVEEFAIGFGPSLYQKKGKKGLLFKINSVPLGGYVKLAGEDGNDEKYDKNDPALFYNKKAWQKFLIAFGGPLFSLLLGYGLLAYSGIVYGLNEVKIETVSHGNPASLSGLLPGDIIKRANDYYVFDPNILSMKIKEGKTLNLDIMRNGEAKSLTVTPKILPTSNIITISNATLKGKAGNKIISINKITNLSELNFTKGDLISIKYDNGSEISGLVGGFVKDTPRFQIGITFSLVSNEVGLNYLKLKENDKIVKMNNLPINSGNDLINAFSSIALTNNDFYIEFKTDKTVNNSYFGTKDDNIKVEVLRNGQISSLIMKKSEITDFFSKAHAIKPGFGRWKSTGVFETIGISIQWANTLLKATFNALVGLVNGKTSTNDIAGPIGMANIIGQAVEAGPEAMINIIALITLNLGLFNLLPLPALDGGRIVFSIYEIITRKRPEPNVEGMIHMIGFILLMAFSLFIIFNDIAKLAR